MAELGARGLVLSYGGHALLDGVTLQLERGERVGLVGRNGSGKSTLLRLLAGEQRADEGELVRRVGLSVAALVQEVPRGLVGTAEQHVRGALAGVSLAGEWELEQRLDRALSTLGLRADTPLASASAGTARRALLAAALAREPDVLILDEPTNHLDVPTIEALERWLTERAGTLLFVTHDRAFLRRVATRILDLDLGRVASYACDYGTYLERKAADLAAAEKERAEFDKKLAQEEAWIRRGIEARRTRNMGRVRALKAMREERRQRRERKGTAVAELQQGQRSGALVLEATGLGLSRGGQLLFRGLDLELLRGDRLGIVGPNGCGKTSLVQVLLGQLAPDTGSLRLGTKLEVGRFDQLHDSLVLDRTLQWNVCGDSDQVAVGGEHRHVISYLGDFLFEPWQVRGTVAQLSGGERNRLQLAKLLARPANLLVLDEPTNDLDQETLELLEALLAEYRGTLIVVSHDREFLDNVVSSTLVFEGGGAVREVVGGYSDWLALRARTAPRNPAPAAAPPTAAPRPRSERRPKLSFAQERELAGLPARIEALEEERDLLHAQLADPALYRQGGTAVADLQARLVQLEPELAAAYARWEELEALAAAARG